MKTKSISLLLALILGASCSLVSCFGNDSGTVGETVGETNAAVETVGETNAPAETAPETVGETEAPAETDSSETAGVNFTLRDAAGKPGDTVKVEINLQTTVEMNSVALYELTYDKDILTFKGFADWKDFEDTRCIIPGGFDDAKEIIVLAMKDTSSMDEAVCNVLFEINPNAVPGTVSVEMSSLVKLYSEVIESAVDGAVVTVE